MLSVRDDIDLSLRMAHLMAGYVRHTLTGDEHDELDRWVTASPLHTRIFEGLTAPGELNNIQQRFRILEDGAREKVRLWHRIRKSRPKKVTPAYTWLAAASLIVALVLFARLHNTEKRTGVIIQKHPQTATASVPRTPYLLLGNGDTLLLKTTTAGTLALQDHTRIDQEGNSIAYTAHETATSTNATASNTLTTPPGTLFRLTLGDGTRVWLNASSSLRYPVSFHGSERTVVLQGEGYFEVAHDAARPFRVQAGSTTVQVLGTQFNIDAYGDDELVKTTLLEGKVQVSCGTTVRTISPGQQARSREGDIDIQNADVETAMAWTKGIFLFRNTPAHTLLAQLSRWYGMELVCPRMPNAHFNATLQRETPVARLLQLLNATGNIHLAQHNNQLIVQP